MADLSGRWQRTRAAMVDADLGGMLLTTEPSVFYLSGTVASRPPGLLLSADPSAGPILVCRDGERDSVAALTDIEVVAAGPGGGPKAIGAALDRLGLLRARIGYEDAAMTVHDHGSLTAANAGVDFVAASAVINRVRLVKDPEEIDYLRQAGVVSDLAMMAAIDALKSGSTESHAAAAAESTMRDHGMFIAYETLIGSGFRSGLLRRYPKLTVPDGDDIIKVDLAAKLSFAASYGYHTDQTRSITTAPPSEAKLELLEFIVAVQAATLAAVRPGRTIRDVSLEGLAVARGTKWAAMTSMSGHGIGLDIHEWPSFNESSDLVLAPGQCFAIEPHIVVPGVHTVCIEDTLVITEDGYERITKLPHALWP